MGRKIDEEDSSSGSEEEKKEEDKAGSNMIISVAKNFLLHFCFF